MDPLHDRFDEVAPPRSSESEIEPRRTSSARIKAQIARRRADSGRDLSPQMSLKENGNINLRLTPPASV
jgi:hypothetical protein